MFLRDLIYEQKFKIRHKYIESEFGFTVHGHKKTAKSAALENKINNIMYSFHMNNMHGLGDQLDLSLKCLEIIISKTIKDEKYKKKMYFDLVSVIVKKKLYDDENVANYGS